jgi:type I restriction enzyme, S subunit
MSVWPEIAFGELVSDETGGNIKTLQSDYLPSGKYPIIDQGQTLIGGYTNDAGKVCKAGLPVIIFGDHTKCFKFIDFPFCLGADGTKILRPKKRIDERYLFYALQRIHIPDAGYSRHFKYLKDGRIPFPSLDEQKRIAAILDRADELRSKRLRVIDRLNQLGQAIFHEMFGDNHQIKRASLKSLGKVSTGSTPPTSDEGSFGGPIPFVTPGDLGSGEAVKRSLSDGGAKKSRTVGARATFVCCIGATIGKMDQAREHSAFNQQINAVEWGQFIEPTYGFYAVQQIRPIIIHKGKGASTTLPILKKSEFEKLEIPCPPLVLQTKFSERIAAVRSGSGVMLKSLGQFNALFDSLQHRAFRGEL